MAGYRKWTTGEARTIASMWGSCPVDEIASKLGRPTKNVYDFATRRMGLDRGVAGNHRRVWSESDDKALLLMYMRGVPTEKIAECLGRGDRAVRRRIGVLHEKYQRMRDCGEPHEGRGDEVL